MLESFSLQQMCRCGSTECRGVIGGKREKQQKNNSITNKGDKSFEDANDKRKNKIQNKKSKDKVSVKIVYHFFPL